MICKRCKQRKENNFLIITNGVTGSGKSGLVKKVIEKYNIKGEYINFLIDDIVEKNHCYKTFINTLVKEKCENELTLCEGLKKEVENTSDDLIEAMSDAYFTTRGSKNNQKCCENDTKENITCDDYLDTLIDNAIEENTNMVFETVGLEIKNWLLDKVQDKYTVYYAYTFVNYKENIRRIKNRGLEMFESYINNKGTSEAPRLPRIDEENIKADLERINKSLIETIKKPNKTIDHIIVFDNNTRRDDKKAWDDDEVLFEYSKNANEPILELNAIEKKIRYAQGLDQRA